MRLLQRRSLARTLRQDETTTVTTIAATTTVEAIKLAKETVLLDKQKSPLMEEEWARVIDHDQTRNEIIAVSEAKMLLDRKSVV